MSVHINKRVRSAGCGRFGNTSILEINIEISVKWERDFYVDYRWAMVKFRLTKRSDAASYILPSLLLLTLVSTSRARFSFSLSILGGKPVNLRWEHHGSNYRLARVFGDKCDSQPRIMRDDSSSISQDQARTGDACSRMRERAFHWGMRVQDRLTQ